MFALARKDHEARRVVVLVLDIFGENLQPIDSCRELGRQRAALAPMLAAKIYGLKVLAERVEDEDHNTTRFVILAREQKLSPRGNGPVVTTFVFRVRNLPAALYKALGGFATNGVNMTKLESYMIEGNFFATMFYADVESHPDDPPLKRALEELEFFSQPGSLKILGVYPGNAKYRSSNKKPG